MSVPPAVEAIPFPKTRGADAAEWLASYGLVPKVPTIRSSDEAVAAHAPFTYYLTRILGLSDPFDDSFARRVGSWAHKRLELIKTPPEEVDVQFRCTVQTAQQELAVLLGERGITGAALAERLNEEAEEATTARAYFEAATAIKIPNTFLSHGFMPWINAEGFVHLTREKRAVWMTSYKGKPIRNVAQYDLLLYSAPTNAIWGFDLKTTSDAPSLRLSSCPFEFQTQHYVKGLIENLDWIKSHFKLPSNTKVGGFYHLAIQKPSIRFGLKDRDYTSTPRTITKGARKGEVEIDKEYVGEPKLANFTKRCIEWMRGEGEYLDKADERLREPVINASITPLSVFREVEDEYYERLDRLSAMATREARPDNFPRTEAGISSYGKLSPWSPFYTLPVSEWPAMIGQKNLVIKRRDDDLPDTTQIGLHP